MSSALTTLKSHLVWRLDCGSYFEDEKNFWTNKKPPPIWIAFITFMFLSLFMNIIQFIISIHALHQYKLLDTIRNIFDRESDSDSESDQSSDSTGPPSLESSQVF